MHMAINAGPNNLKFLSDAVNWAARGSVGHGAVVWIPEEEVLSLPMSGYEQPLPAWAVGLAKAQRNDIEFRFYPDTPEAKAVLTSDLRDDTCPTLVLCCPWSYDTAVNLSIDARLAVPQPPILPFPTDWDALPDTFGNHGIVYGVMQIG
jgi:hypothetical protein